MNFVDEVFFISVGNIETFGKTLGSPQ